MPLEEFVVVDIETTDRYPDCCEICEIAALKVVDWEVIDEFSRLVHIEGEMSGEASPRAFKRKTNILVVSASKSSKGRIRAAREWQKKGSDIKIISEQDFYELLDWSE